MNKNMSSDKLLMFSESQITQLKMEIKIFEL